MKNKVLVSGLVGVLMLASAAVALASGGTSSGSGIPQVGGTWSGQIHFDPSFSFSLQGLDYPAGWTLVEDAAGNITGVDNVVTYLGQGSPIIGGKASSNGTVTFFGGAWYKYTMSITGSVVCADGSVGKVMSGKFQNKEGFGTVSVDNCPVL